jgi:hypothetical protein
VAAGECALAIVGGCAKVRRVHGRSDSGIG